VVPYASNAMAVSPQIHPPASVFALPESEAGPLYPFSVEPGGAIVGDTTDPRTGVSSYTWQVRPPHLGIKYPNGFYSATVYPLLVQAKTADQKARSAAHAGIREGTRKNHPSRGIVGRHSSG